MEQRSQWYQGLLIASLVGVAGLIGVFVYREMFPEYKLYQNAYLELEEFRSTYTGEPVPPFRGGVKQLVLTKEDKGPETIDRCISCHVALDLEHFSPTSVAVDVNGNVRLDAEGRPLLVENDNYVWKKLDEKIAVLREEGNTAEAERLEGLKHVEVGHHHYDVTKVLRMHPLIGMEKRPFELHSMEEFGCTSCHSGNGRGLVTDRAHGPVFDGHYHAEAHGAEPQFLEKDLDNDPVFSKVFNDKPGHRLLFQTEPILVGGLIEANCMQCHQSTAEQMGGAAMALEGLGLRKEKEIESLKKAIADDKQALATLASIRAALNGADIPELREELIAQLKDYRLNDRKRSVLEAQLRYISRYDDRQQLLAATQSEMTTILGSWELGDRFAVNGGGSVAVVDRFLAETTLSSPAEGSVFAKLKAVEEYEKIKQRLANVEGSVAESSEDSRLLNSLSSGVDMATHHFNRGSHLFISQACYACHRIAGYSRGGIGPELTEEGKAYPWFIKESITWPQADLKTSTMPNFKLDHDEVEDLMTFLLAQKGQRKAISEFERKAAITAWEAGSRTPIEQPIAPDKIYNLHSGMKIFAQEGCASCHRLTGFESSVGYQTEKEGGDWDAVYASSQRFRQLFPEEVTGSAIVTTLMANAEEIDQLIVNGVRKEGILEEIESENPGAIESFYSNFKYAARARNKEFEDRIAANPTLKSSVISEKERYLDRVDRVLKSYVQEYGLGRLIGPRVNWSGLYRDDEWLIAHFRNPAAHSPRSIMPVFPYDDSKFYALTHMLNVLAEKNRDTTREIWKRKGFSPQQAYEIHCSNCHGQYLHGNGPTAEWIYPVPKNLRNAYFLRNLTKEKAIQSIVHGVKGGPMAPWGEVASGKTLRTPGPVLEEKEIAELVDWLFRSLPGSQVFQAEGSLPKWQYGPEDILEELYEGGEDLPSLEEQKDDSLGRVEERNAAQLFSGLMPKELDTYYADLEPKVYRKKEPKRRSVEEVFDKVSSETGDKYYIKSEYYTQANLMAGQSLFAFHCSVCHGDEGAGNGTRSEALVDAKPRMLTNLDWLETRDDLRLLRSIKYGVRGTSMTPWGDYTSSLQRMQLVMFIRSLSAEKKLRDGLDTALFQAFEQPVLEIGKERAQVSANLEEVQEQYDRAREERRQAYELMQKAGQGGDQAVKQYQAELEILEQVRRWEAVDALLKKLIVSLEEEQEIYRQIGVNLIERGATKESIRRFQLYLKEQSGRFTVENGKLAFDGDAGKSSTAQEQIAAIVRQIDQERVVLSSDKARVEGQLPSGERNRRLEELAVRLKSLDTLKGRIISGVEDARKAQTDQRTVFQEYQRGLSTLFLRSRQETAEIKSRYEDEILYQGNRNRWVNPRDAHTF